MEWNPLRVDAQHGFLPPAQDAGWLATILQRNRFTGSVWLVDDFREAVRVAEEWPYGGDGSLLMVEEGQFDGDIEDALRTDRAAGDFAQFRVPTRLV